MLFGFLFASQGWFNGFCILFTAMAKFLSGPPGGRTLPQTATRLSDLSGGAYGPGASVASTGINVHRPAIKAGLARAAGETWEDVLEYYSVCILFPQKTGFELIKRIYFQV
jgi:hypothetical protein